MFLGLRTIDMGIKIDVGGGHGGRVNAPWDAGKSSPKIGILWMNDSFGILTFELYLSLWFVSLREVWLASAPGKVCSPSGFASFLLVVSFG